MVYDPGETASSESDGGDYSLVDIVVTEWGSDNVTVTNMGEE